MGTNESRQQFDRNFPMQKYLNRGLTQQQVLMVRTVFLSYNPQAEEIPSQKYRQSLLNSGMKELSHLKLQGKEYLTFEEFFEIEREVLMTQLAKNPEMQVDSTQVDPPSSIFCPYAQEVIRN